MEKLINQLSELIIKAENEGVVPRGCDYILTPWGCIIKQFCENEMLRKDEGETLYNETVIDLKQYGTTKNN